jgi:3-oxoacyl-[acyl-carrier protein] reductase
MIDLKNPEYVKGNNLLKGKSVLITAAAGAGIGFSAATRAVEEGCRAIVISDIHPGRLEASVEKLKQETGLQACGVKPATWRWKRRCRR